MEQGRPGAWLAVAGGAAVGGGIAAALRASALASGAARVPDAWLNALGATVAATALLVWWRGRGPVGTSRRHERARSAVCGMLGSLAVATYWGLGNDLVRYHPWEQFHYYLGGKYFPELSYTELYRCAAVVEAERVGRAAMEGRRMRDLVADRVVRVDAALADPDACRRRFTPERWQRFGDDVMWFRKVLGPIWDRAQQDHGFNPPPTWVLGGGTLARLVGPASARTQTALALVDPCLLAAMFLLVCWAFGPLVCLVALVAWACQVPGTGTWTGGALLRQDWLVCLVAAVCLARRGWSFAAGVALATAAALRIFPVFLVGLPLVLLVRRRVERGRLGLHARRFAIGLVVGGLGWLGLSSVAYGVEAWPAFAEHIAVHRRSPIANHVGLRALLSQSWEGRWMAVMQPGSVDPFHEWETRRRATFAANAPLYYALAAALGVLGVVAGWRIRRLWVAVAASSVLVLAAVDVSSYYCAFFVVLGLLAAAHRSLGWLALGAIVAGRLVNALPVATGNPDLRYTLQSAVFVTWAATALVLVTWPPRLRAARVVPGRRAARRLRRS